MSVRVNDKLSVRIVWVLLVFAVFLAILEGGISVGKGRDTPRFDIDESQKLAETYFWSLLVEKHDIRNPAWNEDFYARTNPPVGKYIFGAAFSLAGVHTESLQLQSDFERLWKDPWALRRLGPDGMLLITRWTSALFGALTAAFLFLIGYRIGGPLAGLLTPVLFFAHPVIRDATTLGLNDSICIAFVTLMVPVSFKAGSTVAAFVSKEAHGSPPNVGDLLIHAVLIPALVTALAVGTKMNGFVVVPAYACFMLLLVKGTAGPGTRLKQALATALLLVATAASSWLAFIVMNPRYYSQPVEKSLQMLQLSKDWTIKQQLEPGGGLFTLAEKSTAVASFTLSSGPSSLCALSGTAGSWLPTLLFLVGVSILLLRSHVFTTPGAAESPARRSDRCNADAVLTWVVLSLVGTTLWLPLVWTRYFIIPYAAVCVASAIGLGAVIAFCWREASRLLNSWRPSSPERREVPARGTELRSQTARSRGIVAVAVFLLWTAICFTPWIVNPALLDPSIAPMVLGRENMASGYVTALFRTSSSNYLVDYHKGLYFLQQRDAERSRRLLEASLAELQRTRDGDTVATIQRARILFHLAVLSAREGDAGSAARFLQEHCRQVVALEHLMVTNDSKIHDEYRRLIAGRLALLSSLPGP